MRWISILVILCFLLPACAKSKTRSGPTEKPAVVASAKTPAKAPVAKPTSVPVSKDTKTARAPAGEPSKAGQVKGPKPHAVPTSDGPALKTVLIKVTSLVSSSPKKAKTKVKDAAVIKAVLEALNTDQILKGKRGGCKFQYGFVLQDASGKGIGTVALCGPLGANTVALFSDDKAWKAWQITVPDGKALAALLDKHLPGAKKN